MMRGAEKQSEKAARTSKTAAPEAPPAAFARTGFYVGAGVGHVWQRANEADTIGRVGPFFSSYSLRGPSGGPFAGFNWQISPLVLGVETDVEAAGASGGEGPSSSVGLRQRQDVRGSALGRVGVAAERSLLYIRARELFPVRLRPVLQPGPSRLDDWCWGRIRHRQQLVCSTRVSPQRLRPDDLSFIQFRGQFLPYPRARRRSARRPRELFPVRRSSSAMRNIVD
jgi:hypothetical protein